MTDAIDGPQLPAKLATAMARAFAQIEGAVKGKTNPAFRSKYADLAAVVDAIKPALCEYGLWFTQRTHRADGGVCVETVIHHESGEAMSCGMLFVPVAKADAQGYGSALTYARRYSLMAAFGVPAEDDDGNGATRIAPAPRQEPAQAPPAAETDAMLSALREAALGGPEALQAAFAALPAGDAKRAVWTQHAASLKAAANKVAA